MKIYSWVNNMECYNLSSYIDDIHGWCGNDLDNVITQCESLCLLSIVTVCKAADFPDRHQGHLRAHQVRRTRAELDGLGSVYVHCKFFVLFVLN
eukprot:SAG22_NODE_227_length_14641_cov_11.007908_11_plen_94_part_00